ncbi:TetR/AcrR family transcriptional regulator [Actinoallomurus sp. NPDC050550]|uniref:TetR/AcrR family transcriptional regulator n=1 Tax=Actinoallomurus sp. NPDC050550 TaxID=3154937 RepID=UPI0033CF88EF
MPKQVDHDQRRRQIAEALWRISADRGLEAVSMREVAAEAGVSIGLVQHYFRDKNDLVGFAVGRLRERIEERVRRSVASTPPPHTPRRLLRAVLVALLPLESEGRTESLVGIAVFIRALGDPDLAATYRRGQALLVTAVADQIRAGVRDGELRPDLDAETEADILLALVSGLTTTLLLGHGSADQVLNTLDHQLARLAT